MAQLTQEQVKKIIENRPKGSDPKQIIEGLVNRGYKLQGLEIPEAPLTPEKPKGRGVLGTIGEVGKGFLKGIGRSAINTGNFAMDAVNTIEPIKKSGLFGGSEPTKIPDILESKNTAQKVGGAIETGVELLAPLPGGKVVAGESLINKARKLYQTALKPSTTLSEPERLRVLKTGLEEGITLTKGGIQKTAEKIDDLERQLGQGIDKAAGIVRDSTGKIISKTGKVAQISTESLRPYIDEVKSFFENTADVAFSQKSVQQLDRMYENLVKKYGDNIGVDVAQDIKTNTYRLLKSHYDKLSAPAIEGSKQIARGFKEGIVKVAPEIDGINKRLGDLYNFEHQLERASGRLGNLNVISLGSKVLAGAGGKVGAGLAIANELFGNAAVKSYGAIKMNKLGEFLSKQNPKNLEAWKTLSKTVGPLNLINFIEGTKDLLSGD